MDGEWKMAANFGYLQLSWFDDASRRCCYYRATESLSFLCLYVSNKAVMPQNLIIFNSAGQLRAQRGSVVLIQ